MQIPDKCLFSNLIIHGEHTLGTYSLQSYNPPFFGDKYVNTARANDKLQEQVLFLKAHLNLNQNCAGPAATLQYKVVAFIIHAESYICLNSESFLYGNYEAVVQKNTTQEELMQDCTIHYFHISQGTLNLIPSHRKFINCTSCQLSDLLSCQHYVKTCALFHFSIDRQLLQRLI